jgi:hypothetical protein
MADGEIKSRIKQARDKLYSRQGYVNETEHFHFKKPDDSLPDNWKHEEDSEDKEMTKTKKKRKNLSSLFMLGSLIFFMIALGFALFSFLGDTNNVSPENVVISTSGPVSISGGDDFSLQIVVSNENSTQLESVNLILEYPEGTRSSKDLATPLTQVRESLGVINSGESISYVSRAVLFGSENEKKDIYITVEYRIAGSNAIFFKDRKYEVVISESPVTLSINALGEVNAGQEIEFEVDVASNSETTLEDLMLKITYPFGFKFIESNVEPTFADNSWLIGDLEPEAGRTIKVVGIMEGQDDEERVFHFDVGSQDLNKEREIKTVFLSSSRLVLIKKPFLNLNLVFDGDTSSQRSIINSSSKVRVDLPWQNNLDSRIDDVEILLKFRGDGINRESISVPDGFYNSSDDSILWSRVTEPNLASIEPGEGGNFYFTFETLSGNDATSLRYPQLFFDATIRAKRVTQSSSAEKISTSLSKEVAISTDIRLSSRATHYTGVFTNSGPLPPKVGQETTYTIIWSVTNSSNSVSDVIVKATLPPYVRWLNLKEPISEDIQFNPIGGEVIWRIGDLREGTGFDLPVREVSFKTSFLPSLSQLDTRPNLVGKSTLEAWDDFTEQELSFTQNAVNTELFTDSSFQEGHDVVVQ